MWKCPQCGEQVEDGFEVCWNCGTAPDGTPDPEFRRAEDVEPESLASPAPVAEARPSPPPLPTPVPAAEPVEPPQPRRKRRRVIVTTTPSVEGRRIARYCGVVTGEAILGTNIFRDFFAGITDIVGGRSSVYESRLCEAREIAMQELEESARELGANAIVGVDIDYETVGGQASMLMVSISGTAVVLE